jgi:hypothetical protein
MELVIRALRGWAVPVDPPIAQGWNALDEKGVSKGQQMREQLLKFALLPLM